MTTSSTKASPCPSPAPQDMSIFHSSPLATLSMVATKSLEDGDLYLLSAAASAASSSPPSPTTSSGTPADADKNGSQRKRKCADTDAEVDTIAADRHWLARERSPFRPSASPAPPHVPSSPLAGRPVAAASGGAWSSASSPSATSSTSASPLPAATRPAHDDGPHISSSPTTTTTSHAHRSSSSSSSYPHPHHSQQLQNNNPYPSPQLPAILPAPRPLHHSYTQQPSQQHHSSTDAYLSHPHQSHSPHTLAPILNQSVTDSSSPQPSHLRTSQENPSASSSVPLPSSSPPPHSIPTSSPSAIPASVRMSLHTAGSTRSQRSSASPAPSSPGHDSLAGNESPFYADIIDTGSRPSTPTSTHLTPDERRRRRLERNRLAARECRQKKKFYVQELEDRAERAEIENQRLRKEVEELNAKLTLGSMHLDRRDLSLTNDRAASPATAASVPLGGAAPTPPPSTEVLATSYESSPAPLLHRRRAEATRRHHSDDDDYTARLSS